MNDGSVFLTYLFTFGAMCLAYYLDIKWRARRIASEMEKVLRKLLQEQKTEEKDS